MITYSIATNEDTYVNSSDQEHLVPGLVLRIEWEAAKFMAENYPEIEFVTRRVPETVSASNRSEYDEYNPEIKAAYEHLEQYVEDYWVDWFPNE